MDIVQRIFEEKAKKIKQMPVHANRASTLGHPCERYLVYERTRWQEKSLHSLSTQLLFDEGRVHEKAVIRDLEDAGFMIIEQQKAFSWKKFQITGLIDGKIILDGKAIPFEVKSMSHHNFISIKSIDDMKKSKYFWIRQYPAQMNLYLLLDEKEYGIMILKDRETGDLKQIDVCLDYEFTESLLKKAERINQHVANQSLPDRISDDKICERCPYMHICLPEITHEATIIDDPDLEIMLERMQALKVYLEEYNALEQEIKQKFDGFVGKRIIGNFIIEGKYIDRKGYEVPAAKYHTLRIKEVK